MFKFKHVPVFISLLFTFFVLAVVLGIVVKSSPQSLLSNLQSKDICFAFLLGLITAIISTMLCLAVSIPTAYAIARYRFFGSQIAKIILDLPIAFPPIVAGLGLFLSGLEGEGFDQDRRFNRGPWRVYTNRHLVFNFLEGK